MMGRLFRTGILVTFHQSAEIQWLQIFLVDLIIWNEEEAVLKRFLGYGRNTSAAAHNNDQIAAASMIAQENIL